MRINFRYLIELNLSSMNFDASYSIKTEKKFETYINNLPKRIKEVFNDKLKYLSKNPNYPSLNTKPYGGISPKIKQQLGIDEVYEFYINRKKYRCLFYVIHQSKELILVFVGTHGQIKNFCKNM